MDVALDRALVAEWVALLSCRAAATAAIPEAEAAAAGIASAAAAATAVMTAATAAAAPASESASARPSAAASGWGTTPQAIAELAKALGPALTAANAAQPHDERCAVAKAFAIARHKTEGEEGIAGGALAREEGKEWVVVGAAESLPGCVIAAPNGADEGNCAGVGDGDDAGADADAELDAIIIGSADGKLKSGIITEEEHAYILAVHNRSKQACDQDVDSDSERTEHCSQGGPRVEREQERVSKQMEACGAGRGATTDAAPPPSPPRSRHPANTLSDEHQRSRAATWSGATHTPAAGEGAAAGASVGAGVGMKSQQVLGTGRGAPIPTRTSTRTPTPTRTPHCVGHREHSQDRTNGTTSPFAGIGDRFGNLPPPPSSVRSSYSFSSLSKGRFFSLSPQTSRKVYRGRDSARTRKESWMEGPL